MNLDLIAVWDRGIMDERNDARGSEIRHADRLRDGLHFDGPLPSYVLAAVLADVATPNRLALRPAEGSVGAITMNVAVRAVYDAARKYARRDEIANG